jgi:hypothetical protein
MLHSISPFFRSARRLGVCFLFFFVPRYAPQNKKAAGSSRSTRDVPTASEGFSQPMQAVNRSLLRVESQGFGVRSR